MVEITIKEEIIIKTHSKDLINFLKDTLWVHNPEYLNKVKRKAWIGKTPKKLLMYKQDQNNYIVPYGFKDSLFAFLSEK